MRCDINGILRLRLPGGGIGLYGIRLYRGDADRPSLLLMSDTRANPGPPILDVASRLINHVCERYGSDPAVMHVVVEGPGDPGFWCLVFEVESDGTIWLVKPWIEATNRAAIRRWAGGRLDSLSVWRRIG